MIKLFVNKRNNVYYKLLGVSGTSIVMAVGLRAIRQEAH
jgi:hypothetical protein